MAFGRFLQSLGYRVAEHPAFGGITTTKHKHYGAPDHYSGGALDITGANMGRIPGLVNQWVSRGMLSKWGPGTLWQVLGHYNHVHVSAHRRGGWAGLPRFQTGGTVGYGWGPRPAPRPTTGFPGMGAISQMGPFGALGAVLRTPQANIGAALQALGMVLQDAARVSQQVLDRLAANIRTQLAQIQKGGITAAERPRANVLGSALGAVVDATQGRFGQAIYRSQQAVERMGYERHIAENRLILAGLQQGTPAYAQAALRLDQEQLHTLQGLLRTQVAALAAARRSKETDPQTLADLQAEIDRLTTTISDTEVSIYQDQQAATEENTQAMEEQTAALEKQTAELEAANRLKEQEIELLKERVTQERQRSRTAESQYDVLADAVAQAANRGIGGMIGLKRMTPGSPGQLATYR